MSYHGKPSDPNDNWKYVVCLFAIPLIWWIGFKVDERIQVDRVVMGVRQYLEGR